MGRGGWRSGRGLGRGRLRNEAEASDAEEPRAQQLAARRRARVARRGVIHQLEISVKLTLRLSAADALWPDTAWQPNGPISGGGDDGGCGGGGGGGEGSGRGAKPIPLGGNGGGVGGCGDGLRIVARQGGGGNEPRCGGTESYRGALQEQRASLVGVGHVGDENVVVVPDGGEGVDKIRGKKRGAWG